MTRPLAMRVGWLERLLPERHVIGATASERARLTLMLAFLSVCFTTSALFLLWGLFDSSPAGGLDVIYLLAALCFGIDGLLLLRFGCPRWLVYAVVLQIGVLTPAFLVVTGQLAFSVWLLAPPMLLMLLAGHRAGYIGAAFAVLIAVVLGGLKASGLLPEPEVAGFVAFVDPDVLAITLWLMSHLSLSLVFDRRRRWAAGEAHLISWVLINVREHADELLSRLHEHLTALLDAPGLSEEALEALRDAELSEQRLREVIEQLDIAGGGTTEVGRLQDDPSERVLASVRLIRFQLQVSMAFLLLCALLLPVLLLLRGLSYPLTWVLLSALALLMPNILLLRRLPAPRPTALWLTFQMALLCAISTLVNGDLAHAVWLSLLPVLLLYAIGVRWALSSTAVLIVLVVILSVLLNAGYGLPPEAPLTGSLPIDRALFNGLFIITNISVLGYFERDRKSLVSILTLRSSALSKFSHELRTPLNGLLGTFAWLREELPPGEKASAAHLSLAERHGQQLLSIIDDALSLAVLSGGRMQRRHASFRLPELAGRLQKEAERLGKIHHTDINISLEQPRPVQFSGEHERLEKMLMSLLVWACAHRPGQALRLRLKTLKSARGRWHLQVALFDIESPLTDERSSGLAELFGADQLSDHRNALRVALCRAQLDFLAGRWEAAERISKGLRLRLPLDVARN